MTFESESEMSQELEDEFEDESSLEGEGWLGAIGNAVGSLLGESEGEGEYEDESAYESEDEGEGEINPIRKIYPDAMMEHLGELAAEAESEDEAAEHFLPLVTMAASKLLPAVARAIAPAARRALPKIVRAVTHSSPKLTRGIGTIAKTLHRNPQTRHLLKTVPTIARRTVGSIAKQAARGRTVSPQAAVRALAHQARYVLGNPAHRRHALQRHNRLERTFHGRLARGMARPHVQGGQRYGWAPGARRTGGWTGAQRGPGATYGRSVGGRCVCGSGQGGAPAFCRCCGQALR